MLPGRRFRNFAASTACLMRHFTRGKPSKWKAKYGGMTVSELRRLKDLEAENSELKRLLADAMLDNAGLKGLLAKNS